MLKLTRKLLLVPVSYWKGYQKLEKNKIYPCAVIGMEAQYLKYDGEFSWVKIGHNDLIQNHITINCAAGIDEKTCIGNRNLIMAYVHMGHNGMLGDLRVYF